MYNKSKPNHKINNQFGQLKRDSTMVTTGLLALERLKESGLSDWGRSLSPEKSAEMLPLENGERKLVDREVLKGVEEVATMACGEVRGGAANMRVWSRKLDADAVATSIR